MKRILHYKFTLDEQKIYAQQKKIKRSLNKLRRYLYVLQDTLIDSTNAI